MVPVAGGGRGRKRPVRVLAVVKSVFFPNEPGFSGHAAIGPHRSGTLGSFVFPQHAGADPPFFFQHAAPFFPWGTALLGLCTMAGADQ